MTLAMPDSVNVNQLPVGYDAYLGYDDGEFQTAAALRKLFPEANLVILTVTGAFGQGTHGVLVASGVDAEPGDVTAAAAVNWAASHLAPAGAPGPVIYASVIGNPGFGMVDVLDRLEHARIARSEVRLLSAHYGEGPHICGPDSCDAIAVEMDGTQWTDQFTTPAGAVIDMSMLRDDFFAPAQSETERLVTELGIVRQGMTGDAVKTVQGLCNARNSAKLTIDGIFGGQTEAAVIWLQSHAHVTTDGIVGPQTWPVLLGVA